MWSSGQSVAVPLLAARTIKASRWLSVLCSLLCTLCSVLSSALLSTRSHVAIPLLAARTINVSTAQPLTPQTLLTRSPQLLDTLKSINT